jgi:hypothetical protein
MSNLYRMVIAPLVSLVSLVALVRPSAVLGWSWRRDGPALGCPQGPRKTCPLAASDATVSGARKGQTHGAVAGRAHLVRASTVVAGLSVIMRDANARTPARPKDCTWGYQGHLGRRGCGRCRSFAIDPVKSNARDARLLVRRLPTLMPAARQLGVATSF